MPEKKPNPNWIFPRGRDIKDVVIDAKNQEMRVTLNQFNSGRNSSNNWAGLNSLYLRQNLYSIMGLDVNNKRNYKEMFGYLSPTSINMEAYFRYNGLAYACGAIMPKATWTSKLMLVDADGEKGSFSKAFRLLNLSRKLIHTCQRADMMCAYGRYAAIVINLVDGMMPDEPAAMARNTQLYGLTPFSENNIKVPGINRDVQQALLLPMPEYYYVQTGGTEGSQPTGSFYDGGGGNLAPKKEIRVHSSRVVHVADGMVDNDLVGAARLSQIFERIQDVYKLQGSATEAFWQAARNNLYNLLNENFDVEQEDLDKIAEDMDEFQNDPQAVFVGKGTSIGRVNTPIHNPAQHFDILIKEIATKLEMPYRKLVGAEQAKVASTTDESSWASKIEERRFEWAEQYVLRPLVTKLIEFGVMPEPKGGEYEVVWPPVGSETATDKMKRLVDLGVALGHYEKNAIYKYMSIEAYLDQAGIKYDEDAVKEYMKKRLELEKIGMPEPEATPPENPAAEQPEPENMPEPTKEGDGNVDTGDEPQA